MYVLFSTNKKIYVHEYWLDDIMLNCCHLPVMINYVESNNSNVPHFLRMHSLWVFDNRGNSIASPFYGFIFDVTLFLLVSILMSHVTYCFTA